MDTKQDKEKYPQPKVSLDAHVSTFRIENPTAGDLDGSSEMNDQTSGSKSLVSAKRAAQNRAAQRAFRQRKEQHIKGLESKAKLLNIVIRNNIKLKAENESLWQIITKVKGGENIHKLVLPEKAELEDEGKVESINYFEEPAQDDPSYNMSYAQKEEAISPTFKIKSFSSAPEDKRFSSPVPPPSQGKVVDFRRLSSDSNSTTSSCSFSPNNPNVFQRRLSSHGFPGPSPTGAMDPLLATSAPATNLPKQAPRHPSVVSLNDEKLYSYQQTPDVFVDNQASAWNQNSTPSMSSPHFNQEGANLAFLQYGWIFESHTPQPDRGGSYTGVFGMSQKELDQNHEIMDNLYSLLKMDPELSESTEELPKPSSILSSKPVDVN
ncbi:hypothetical protein K493DRAFT_412047 [Basidiobolus meristosporus CBS 931.73]|uniref:BZIP domain-containing protein n=1 Tax=Basidiobolus meristosporus CBS 931.73 TaxID=1314790 RepID=A0A1Y1X5L9_9FUNG|nr:hypothetical protein K493DRAFT_412047 [Basidiobolus meristosporus CBS 931.73]|eukprot:ORX81111.1 hypothetical protein K493DRAFT_412047 [Basidiobolus meristosporus CBS 931.73]